MKTSLTPQEPEHGAVEKWDTIIRPHNGWFNLHLVDLWRYRDLIILFIRRDFVAQYKQSILGPVWFVLQPLLTTFVFTIVFGNIAGLSTDGLPKLLFYFSGQVVWGYFSGTLTAVSSTFVDNAHIFGKVYFPRLTIPVSIVISHLGQFGLRLFFLLCFFLYFFLQGEEVRLSFSLLLLPVLILIMFCLALGLGIIFSSMTTKYRDLRFLLAFGVQLLMYATTVIFPLSSIANNNYRFLIQANPMTPIIECFRHAFTGVGSWEPIHLCYSAGFALITLLVGLVFFTRIERTFVDTV